jgi:hypothetical protein
MSVVESPGAVVVDSEEGTDVLYSGGLTVFP